MIGSSNIIIDLGLLLIIATILSFIANKLKQPLILAYIVAGLLLGGFLSNQILDFDNINLLAQLGIAFLLFMVGLELNFNDLKHIARVSFYVGIGQVVFTFIIGYFLLRVLNYNVVESLYISIALTFSSTIIILKLLSDKGDLHSLYGKISVGALLIQDFIALIILIALAGFSANSGAPQDIAYSLAKGIGFIIAVMLLSKYALSKLFTNIAKSQELLFLSSVALCFLFIIIANWLGLSIEIGSFLAGLSLANLPFRLEIGNKIKPLRDFFIVLFFITLGTQMAYTIQSIPVGVAITLSLFVLIGNPLIVLILMGVLGYKKRTSFFTGLIVAQISEFSLILVALGYRLGHISAETVSLVTVVGVVTITLSVYMVEYNQWLYDRLSRFLNIFEKRDVKKWIIERLSRDEINEKHDYVLFGCHRLGYRIAKMLKDMHKKLLVIDFDPAVIKKLKHEGVKCIYGDMGDYELFDELRLNKAEFVISTVLDKNSSIVLVRRIKTANKKVKVVLTANDGEDALMLYKAGADYVIVPQILSGEKSADILRIAIRDKNVINEVKKRHIFDLKKLGWYGD